MRGQTTERADHRHTRVVIDPLLGDNQPSADEFIAARRWARRSAAFTSVGIVAIGFIAMWLTSGGLSVVPFVFFGLIPWLCVPIWTRQKIARDNGLPRARIY